LNQACSEFVKLAQEQGTRWQKLLQYEHEQRLQLENMVEQLGKQHSNLEKQIRKSMNGAIGQQVGVEG
jgi:oxysterol-binding protein 1